MPTPATPQPAREALGDEAPDPRAQAAQAARAAMAQVLRERAALVQDLDGEIGRLVDAALARITAQLSGAPTDYQLWVLPRLMEGVQRVMDELAASAAAQTANGLRQAWELGTRLVDAPVAAEAAAVAAAPVPAPATLAPAVPLGAASAGLGTPDLRQLRALQHMATGLIKGASTDTVNSINRQLGQVVLGAAQPFDAIRTVAQLLPDRTRAQVRGIVNSNLATALNTAAFQRLQQQAARDPAIRKQWRRSGKLHSRANHDAADGQVQDVNVPFTLVDGHKPGRFVQLMYPADPQAPVGETIHCGCVALPWKATWKMRQPAAAPLTAAERKARAAAAKPARKKAITPGVNKTAMNTQDRILGAFAAGNGSLRDVTGQTLTVDARLFPPDIGDARLTKAGQDLYSYNAVQALKRPTEVWQQERIDPVSGAVLRERLFLKRFTAAGQAWVGQARFRLDGTTWVPAAPYRAQAAGATADAEMTAARAGARVYPPRR